MIERTNCTTEEKLQKYVGEDQNSWSGYLPLVMMAYGSSTPLWPKLDALSLFWNTIDCMYQTIKMKIYPTSTHYVCCLKDKIMSCHELVRESMDVGLDDKKIYYDRKTALNL